MTPTGTMSSFRGAIRSLSKSLRFYKARPPVTRQSVSFDKVIEETQHYRVVLFGEQHQQPQILRAQLCVMEGMITTCEEKTKETGRPHSLSLVMEMFNFDQQQLLDDFAEDVITIDDVLDRYRHSEGFDLENHYGHLLVAAKELNIRLVAGFVPKEMCRNLLHPGADKQLDSFNTNIGTVDKFYIEGSEEHYRYFQSLITGDTSVITDKYRRIFPAQVLRDSSLAYRIRKCIDESSESRVLAICGSGHVDFNFGVPERIPSDIPVLVLTSRTTEDPIEEDVADLVYHYNTNDCNSGGHFNHP